MELQCSIPPTILVFIPFTSLLANCAALDTISANEPIKDGNTIIPNGDMYELGFFSPGKSKTRYLGIWYKKISTGTVVWVANRETPITDTSGMFKVSENGSLLILNGNNTQIWSSNSVSLGSKCNNAVAQLLNTGNLVVWDENHNLIWESFDYPGDTFLEGMRIGKDLVTGLQRSMTSWKTPDDPSIGMPSRMDNRVGIRNHNLRQQDEDVIEEDSNRPNNTQGNARKRVRGPTFMPKVWAKSEEDHITVSCNEFGQAIDVKTTSTLTHFMGSLARSGKYCPLHKPWNKVSKAKKQILLDTLNEKFEIPESASVWILRSFGRKVKNWRARVKKYHYDPSMTFDEQISAKPKRVRVFQWKKLVKSWNKRKYKRFSEKNKASRAKKKMVPVTGKKSYARVREELKVTLGDEPSRMELFRARFSKDGITKNV